MGEVYQPGGRIREMTRPFLCVALAACVCVTCACDRKQEGTPAPTTGAATSREQPSAAVPAPKPSDLATRLPADAVRASLPPLPVRPAPRPRDYVLAAYEFAALHPEVLKYVPCYCGCEQSGHQHNESCFIGSRDAQGRVVSWDLHGMG
jgi:hypothetical protein